MAQETSHYTVLARRFRPQQFDDVVGQQHVAQSLRNAIRAGRVAHAYLFSGARGVGKTSMARILAKALNCPEADDGVPCNSCEICQGISSGNDVDILEIDGASNRGIDDIRSLRANVNVKSMRTRYKVYIVDEVHMLTREAFNALLKTLEEPPPGVKFVFCTTEPNKVPDTILSRCQRFDFSSISTQCIAERLSEIAAAEGVDVEPAAVELVARRAAGSMRDSQSLFDQLLAFGGSRLAAADVHRLLGTADDDCLMAVVGAAVKRDAAEALRELDQTLNNGVRPGELANQLLACTRDLMVLHSGAESVPLMGISEANRSGFRDLGTVWGMETILAAMQILNAARDQMMRSTQARAIVETAIVRIAMLEDLTEISKLLSAAPAEKKNEIGTVAAEPVMPTCTPEGTTPEDQTAPTRPDAVPGSSTEKESRTNSAEPTVELIHGNESAFQSQLVQMIKDTTRDHLGTAALAISGPNQLDLRFSKDYHFSKQYCEQPDVLKRLQKAASKIAGKPIRIRLDFTVDDSPSPPTNPKQPPPAKTSAPEDDAFLQEAINIFRATLVRTERS